MGSACGKGDYEGDAVERAPKRGINRKRVVSPANVWEDLYSLTMDCFTVPADRLLVNLPRFNVGDGCRAVVVTTVNLEKRNVPMPQSNKLSNLNSVLYTPVLQWFGLDVKKQVPRFLPMNLWPGSYTVFGFYEPENVGKIHVTLSGKIGPEEVYLEEMMDTKKSLSAEEWSSLSGKLEKELRKTHPELNTNELTARLETLVDYPEEPTPTVQRMSQDTGYVSSHKHSVDQPPYSALRYSQSVTPDIEELSVKEIPEIKEKQKKLRRKDTPSHHGLSTAVKIAKQFDTYKKQADDFPLQEESEASEMSKESVEVQITCLSTQITNIGSSQEESKLPDVFTVATSVASTLETQFLTQTIKMASVETDDSLQMPQRLTKSCQDFAVFKAAELQQGIESRCERDSTQSLASDKSELKSPSIHRKKKRSIVSKVAKSVAKDEDPVKQSGEHGDDADDEYEKSLSEASKSDPKNKNYANVSACDSNNEDTVVDTNKDDKSDLDKLVKQNITLKQDTDNTSKPEVEEKESVSVADDATETKSNILASSLAKSQPAPRTSNEKKKKLSIGQKTLKASKNSSSQAEAQYTLPKESKDEQPQPMKNTIDTVKTSEEEQKEKLKKCDNDTSSGSTIKSATDETQKITRTEDESVKTDYTERHEQPSQSVTVMAKVLQAMSSSEKNGNTDTDSKNKSSATQSQRSLSSPMKKNVIKKFSYSEVTEPQMYSKRSSKPSSTDIRTSTERSSSRVGSSGDRVRQSTLMKSQSAIKIGCETKEATNEFFSKESRYDVSKRSVRGAYYSKQVESSSSESDSRRPLSKSFSTTSRPQHFVRKKVRQSLEGRLDNRKDSKPITKVTKPIQAFEGQKESQ